MASEVTIHLNGEALTPAIEQLTAYLSPGGLPVEVAQRLADAVKLLLCASKFFVSKSGGLPASRAGGLFIDLEPSEPLRELLAAVAAGDFDFLAICERHGFTPSLVEDACGSSDSIIEGVPFSSGGQG